MSLVRFSNQLPSLFDRFFENDIFDWSNRNFSNTKESSFIIKRVKISSSRELLLPT